MRKPAFTQNGLTLPEMLVVLVISSLIATLLIQGTGFFLNSYQIVLKRQGNYGTQAMVLSWYRESIEALVASADDDFAFSGDDRYFEGYTLQPVQGVSGRLTHQRWSLEQNGQNFELWLKESEHQPMLVQSWLARNASLSYRIQNSQWYEQWPYEGVPPGGLPLRIKLTVDLMNEELPTEIHASVPVRRLPRLDYRDSVL